MLSPKPNKPASKKPRVMCCGWGVITSCGICGEHFCTKCDTPHDGVGGAIVTPIDRFTINGVNGRINSDDINPYEGIEVCNECLDKYFREIPFKWGNESESDYRARVAKAEAR